MVIKFPITDLPINSWTALIADIKELLPNYMLPKGCLNTIFFITRTNENRINLFDNRCKLIAIMQKDKENKNWYGIGKVLGKEEDKPGFVRLPNFANPIINMDESFEKAKEMFKNMQPVKLNLKENEGLQK